MWILPLVGYTGVLLGFGFLTLAIGTPLIGHPPVEPFVSRLHYTSFPPTILLTMLPQPLVFINSLSSWKNIRWSRANF